MFWFVAGLVLAVVVAYSLMPKPQSVKPNGINDVNTPTSEDGREFPVFRGTCWLEASDTGWLGDFRAKAIKVKSGGGLFGGSKKQTIGYYYYLGLQLFWSIGPIDKFLKLAFGEDKRIGWEGEQAENGTITVNKGNLFGGKKKEGGVGGLVDIEFGASDQSRNAYLQGQIGNDIPAYRGLFALVFRQFYFGTSTYLKKISVLAQCVHTRQDGIAQWYDEKAAILRDTRESLNLSFVLDGSGSMLDIVSGTTTRWDIQEAEIHSALEALKPLAGKAKVGITIYGDEGNPANLFRSIDSSSDIDELKQFISDFPITIPLGTYWSDGMQGAADFFAWAGDGESVVVFTTDGAPTGGQTETDAAIAIRNTIPDVKVHVLNIDLASLTYSNQLDNTGGADVVSSAGGGEITEAALSALQSIGIFDINVAHYIRDALTDPDWGRGLPEVDMGDSFTTAADVFFDEGMGISLRWDRQKPIEEFIEVLLAHADAALYEDRKTGKWELKPIRFNYDPDTLDVLDKSVITKLDKPAWRTFGDLPTAVTVVYTDPDNGKDASAPFSNPALAALQQREKETTLQYPGFHRADLAARVAARDAKSLGSEIFTTDLIGTRALLDYNAGDVIKLDWPEYGISNMIMRVTQGPKVEGRNKIRLPVSTDVYALPDIAPVSAPTDEWVDTAQPPEATDYHIAVEAPYFELIQRAGQSATDALLAENNGVGIILATAVRPAYAINASLYTDAGAGYEESEEVDFCPHAVLAVDIGPTDTVWSITAGVDLTDVRIGSHAQIDGELFRVDAISDTQVTVGRGVLDTVPVPHTAGASIFFWDDYAETDGDDYVASDEIDVKVVPESGSGIADIADITADTVTMATRAFRPYPPGNLLIDSQAYPAVISGSATFAASVAHRDRTQQTSGTLHDTTYSNIGPEVGVTYTWTLYRTDTEAVLQSYSGDNATSKVFTPGYDGEVRLEVKSVRDAKDGWQSLTHTFLFTSEPEMLFESEAAGDQMLDEFGNFMILEGE
ncbi:hypothetical protein GCM10011348_45730 [Marinobacterium nitratireducens]|uniref:VWFA domain-containing protein n=1 Tax=Marinobacterium nitratireducens TaxID=518897 RepID=A0A917ZQP9_9GAMM|nr:phage tail protein [Marinobacterium nitratireducens]GGO89001.1 hypothetical protein GCM10011348_45730 [Marinobacterium nitratireducens]